MNRILLPRLLCRNLASTFAGTRQCRGVKIESGAHMRCGFRCYGIICHLLVCRFRKRCRPREGWPGGGVSRSKELRYILRAYGCTGFLFATVRGEETFKRARCYP